MISLLRSLKVGVLLIDRVDCLSDHLVRLRKPVGTLQEFLKLLFIQPYLTVLQSVQVATFEHDLVHVRRRQVVKQGVFDLLWRVQLPVFKHHGLGLEDVALILLGIDLEWTKGL